MPEVALRCFLKTSLSRQLAKEAIKTESEEREGRRKSKCGIDREDYA